MGPLVHYDDSMSLRCLRFQEGNGSLLGVDLKIREKWLLFEA
jgi:hypothetical protein